jgi:hypothetical protein
MEPLPCGSMSHTGNTPGLTSHALERVDERLVGNEAEAVIRAVNKACQTHGTQSLGIIAHNIGGQRGQAWGQKSNGDNVVVIVRRGRVATVMLRRSTQTFTLDMSRTDKLVDMTGKILSKPLTSKTSSVTTQYRTGRNGRRGRRVEVPRNIFANN